MIYEKIALYEGREDVTLTTYILDDSVEMLNGRKRGAILICPGGAYLYCSDREGEPIAMAFSAMGYHTFVLRYSVYNENKGKNTIENILPNSDTPWINKEAVVYPGPMRDIGKALIYIKEHEEAWHVDMDKVALCGFSAGAHNCAMYSVNYDKPVITDYFGIDSRGIRPTAVILGYMTSDYVDLKYDSDAMELLKAHISAYTGKEKLEDKAFAEKLSPSRLVNQNTPPMFLWATSKDNLVDPGHSLKMALALNKYKVPYEVHIFEEGKHGMALGTAATASGTNEIDEDVAGWVHMVDRWLQKRMMAELPETSNGF